jgi:hypothetical protein
MSQEMGAVSPSNFQNRLAGIDFPAGPDELIQQARDNQAESDVIDLLKRFPDRDYDSMADVMAAYDEIGVR